MSLLILKVKHLFSYFYIYYTLIFVLVFTLMFLTMKPLLLFIKSVHCHNIIYKNCDNEHFLLNHYYNNIHRAQNFQACHYLLHSFAALCIE